MDADQIEELRHHYEARREALNTQLPTLKASAQPVAPDTSLGRLTRQDAMQAMEINAAALRQMQAELGLLDYALSHMNAPEFGHCAECDGAIPLGRLKAVPGTRHCVKCV